MLQVPRATPTKISPNSVSIGEFASAPPRTGCPRCGGLMVEDWGAKIVTAQEDPLNKMLTARCVQCGEIIDPVILQNRMGTQESTLGRLARLYHLEP